AVVARAEGRLPAQCQDIVGRRAGRCPVGRTERGAGRRRGGGGGRGGGGRAGREAAAADFDPATIRVGARDQNEVMRGWCVVGGEHLIALLRGQPHIAGIG